MEITHRKAYDAGCKLMAVEFAIKEGNRAAARKFGVSESMVRRWRQMQDKLSKCKKKKKAFRGHKSRWPELENILEEWVKAQRAEGRRVSTLQIRLKALEIATDKKIDDFSGGPSWCLRFMRRKGLIRPRTTVCQQLPPEHEETPTNFCNFTQTKIGPDDIINMDEVPLMRDLPLSTRTVGQKGDFVYETMEKQDKQDWPSPLPVGHQKPSTNKPKAENTKGAGGKCVRNSVRKECCVLNCGGRTHNDRGQRIRNNLTFHSFPVWRRNMGVFVSDLTKRCREAWVKAVGRADITFDDVPDEAKVCSKHFVSGEPAYELMEEDQDWVPSLFLSKEPEVVQDPIKAKRKPLKKEPGEPAYEMEEDPDWVPSLSKEPEVVKDPIKAKRKPSKKQPGEPAYEMEEDPDWVPSLSKEPEIVQDPIKAKRKPLKKRQNETEADKVVTEPPSCSEPVTDGCKKKMLPVDILHSLLHTMENTHRKAYDAGCKLMAIEFAIKEGNRAAARKFGVSESMVRRWRQMQDKLSKCKKKKKAFRGHKSRWPELENILEEWVKAQRAEGRRVSTLQIRLKALEMATEKKIAHFRGAPSWCLRFMRRKGLIRPRTTVCQQLPPEHEETPTNFCNFTQTKIGPDDIINMDEVPLMRDLPLSTRTVGQKGDFVYETMEKQDKQDWPSPLPIGHQKPSTNKPKAENTKGAGGKCVRNSVRKECCVLNCGGRTHNDRGQRIRNNLTFHSFPVWRRNMGVFVSDLTKRCREAWVKAVGRADITFDDVPDEAKVCSKHFVSGEPAYELMEEDPDWVPSLFLSKEPEVVQDPIKAKRKPLKKEPGEPAYEMEEDPDWVPSLSKEPEIVQDPIKAKRKPLKKRQNETEADKGNPASVVINPVKLQKVTQERPGAERPGAERPGPGAERPGPGAERPGPGAERPGAERPGPGAERPGAERPGAERPGAERPGADPWKDLKFHLPGLTQEKSQPTETVSIVDGNPQPFEEFFRNALKASLDSCLGAGSQAAARTRLSSIRRATARPQSCANCVRLEERITELEERLATPLQIPTQWTEPLS